MLEYIYIFRSFGRNCSHLKFGFTAVIKKRLDCYRHHNPHVEIVYIAQLEDAHIIEQDFHNKYKPCFGNEWYEESMLETMIEFLNTYKHSEFTLENKLIRTTHNTFKGTVIELQKGDSDFALCAFKKYPFLHEAIELMGFKGIEELEYNATNVKRKLITLSKTSNSNKIGKELELVLNEGQFYEYNTLKKLLYAIYNKYIPGSKTTAKDIERFYNVKHDAKRKDKVTLKGYTLLKKRLI